MSVTTAEQHTLHNYYIIYYYILLRQMHEKITSEQCASVERYCREKRLVNEWEDRKNMIFEWSVSLPPPPKPQIIFFALLSFFGHKRFRKTSLRPRVSLTPFPTRRVSANAFSNRNFQVNIFKTSTQLVSRNFILYFLFQYLFKQTKSILDLY